MISKLFVLFFVTLAQSGHLSQTYNNPWTYNSQNNAHGALYVEQHVPIIVNGVPVETKEVQEAKAQHFAAVAQAKEVQAREWQKKTSSYQSTPIYVESAWANGNTEGHGLYQQGVNEWNAYIGNNNQQGHRYRRSIASYGYQNQHVPVITKEGVPVETPEVLQAKALHQQAYQNAKLSHNAWKSSQSLAWQPQTNGWENNAWKTASQNHAWQNTNNAISTVSYTVNHSNNYGWQKLSHQPQHIPVLGKNGVPFDTTEVQLAKQQHLLAHQQAELNKWNNVGVTTQYHQHVPSLTASGVPVETSEVQVAKAQHLAAHQAEQAKHSAWAGFKDDDNSQYTYGDVAGYHGDESKAW